MLLHEQSVHNLVSVSKHKVYIVWFLSVHTQFIAKGTEDDTVQHCVALMTHFNTFSAIV